MGGRVGRWHQLGWLLLIFRVATLHAWMGHDALLDVVVWRLHRRRTLLPPSSLPSWDAKRRRPDCRRFGYGAFSQTHASNPLSSSSHDASSLPALPRNSSATASASILDPPVPESESVPVPVPVPSRGHYNTLHGVATTATNIPNNSRKKDRPPLAEGVLRRPFLHSPDEVATTTLGDIMGLGMVTGAPPTGSSSDDDGIATSPPGTTTSLREKYGIYHPLDRIALTANGNLQRLVGSYYDSPVSVVLDSQTRVDSVATPEAPYASSHVWERAVHLTVFGQTFCTATSIIHVRDATCQALVESGQVGLGQLFRYLDLLPEFTLLDAGPSLSSSGDKVDDGSPTTSTDGGGGDFWRQYRLECRELSCWIREEFCPGLWTLTPPPPPPPAEGDDLDPPEKAAEAAAGLFE